MEAEVPVRSTVFALVEGFQAELGPYNKVIEQNGAWQDIWKWNSHRRNPRDITGRQCSLQAVR